MSEFKPFSDELAADLLAEAEAAARRRSSVIWLSDVDEEAVTWTWRGYLPDGKLVVLDGDPGLGKSVLWTDLVARISQGDQMPNGQPLESARTCLVVSAEDDLADTIKPRLRAAGAAQERVATLRLRSDEDGLPIPFTVPNDMDRLRAAVLQHRPALVVIDPVMAFVSEGIQSHNDASIRRALTPLAELAQETRAVIMLVRHLNKDTRQTSALHRGGGSIGISGAARTVLLLAPVPDDSGDLVLAVVKGNLSRGKASSIRLRVEPWIRDPELPRIKWIGHSNLAADDLLAVTDARLNSPERDEAAAFLWSVLSGGPLQATDVLSQAKVAGIAATTLKRAAGDMGLKKEQMRDSEGRITGWTWKLP